MNKKLNVIGSVAFLVVLAVFVGKFKPLAHLPSVSKTASVYLGYSGFAGPAELPRAYVDTTMPTQTGQTINVPAGGDLQAAINNAQPGDTIVLQAGATYIGNFNLPAKSNPNNKWIIIKSNGTLPPEGTRVSPSNASQMAKIMAPYTTNAYGETTWTAINANSYSNYYRLIGLEITVDPKASAVNTLLMFGTPDGTIQPTLASVPHHLVLDRSYVHAWDTIQNRRCINLNSAWSAIIDSYVSQCENSGYDVQAIAGGAGPGPYKIVNNFLSAGSEDMAFGGFDPAYTVVPSDIEIRGNYFYRPLTWRAGNPYNLEKNAIEFKAGQRVLIEGNVLENTWQDAQVGWGFALWSANQGGNAPWTVTSDFVIRNNILKNINSPFSLTPKFDKTFSTPFSRAYIANNLDFGRNADNPGYREFNISIDDLTIIHNTVVGTDIDGFMPISRDGLMHNFVFKDNIAGSGGGSGITDPYVGSGIKALDDAAPGWTFDHNVFLMSAVDQTSTWLFPYPANNFYPVTFGDIGFVNAAGGDWHLSSNSPYKGKASDGTDPGADIDMLLNATRGAISGSWSGGISTPPPVTQPPASAPTVTVSANPTSITSGQSSVVTWSSTNASSCTSSNLGTISTSGSKTVTPSTTTTYSISCTGSGGTASNSVTVTVSATTPPPTTNTPPKGNFDGLEADGVTFYGWSYDPDASSQSNQVSIYADGAKGSGTLLATITANVSRPDVDTYFNITGNHGFELPIPANLQDGISHTYYVYGLDTTDNTTTQVGGSPKSFTVFATPPPPSTPTLSLSANPTVINLGESSTISWTSTNTTSCSGSDGLGTGLPSSGSATLAPSVTTTYSMTCTGTGGTVTQSTTVSVNTTPTTPPPTTALQIGDWIMLTQKTNVRQGPQTGGKPLGSQSAGAKGQLLSGPTQGSGYTWWNVDYTSGADGWSIQGYMIKTDPPAPLSIGSRVTTTERLNVRSAPTTSATLLGKQNAGATGTITDGPQTGSGYTWWKVDFDSGVDGWVVDSLR